MRAKNLTEPGKKKCSYEDCRGDLPNTMFAPPSKSTITGKEICVDCKTMEILIGAAGSRSMEI
jgi:hypothetical protein